MGVAKSICLCQSDGIRNIELMTSNAKECKTKTKKFFWTGFSANKHFRLRKAGRRKIPLNFFLSTGQTSKPSPSITQFIQLDTEHQSTTKKQLQKKANPLKTNVLINLLGFHLQNIRQPTTKITKYENFARFLYCNFQTKDGATCHTNRRPNTS